MATISTQAAPAATAAVIGSGIASHTSETIVGSHIFRIEAFSATKDLGVGKCIKSSSFRVGGHGLYIECYPCGDVEDEDSAGWVSLFLCRQEEHPRSRVSGYCEFALMESLKDRGFKKLFRLEDDDERYVAGTDDIIEREELESLLKDDCFQVRCVVIIEKFPAAPPPDLATETMARSHSHVLTVHDYYKIRRAFVIGQTIESSRFRVGGESWYLEFYPSGNDENDADGVTTYLCLEFWPDDEVKVRIEMTLLTLAGKKISSNQDFYTFSDENTKYLCKFLSRMEHESSPLLQDGIQIRCDVAVVKEITAVQPPPERPDHLHGHFGELLTSQLGTDVTFEVGGDLFPAHKCVLATRSTAFMAEFFGTGKENADVTQVLRIHNMEPRVFKALLDFIYTEDLPEVCEEDKVVMAQGLLVAADRYAMERLKLICADMLCSYVDATTAVATLELAEKYGCLKLKEVCIQVIRDWLAKVTP